MIDGTGGETTEGKVWVAIATVGDVAGLGGAIGGAMAKSLKSARGVQLGMKIANVSSKIGIAANATGAGYDVYLLATDEKNQGAHAGDLMLRLALLGLSAKQRAEFNSAVDDLAESQGIKKAINTADDAAPDTNSVDKPTLASENTSHSSGASPDVAPSKASISAGVDYDPHVVAGPNPNNLRMRVVDEPTTDVGVYLKPHDGKTKVGSTGGTNTFRSRYTLKNPEGGGPIEVEIPQTRFSKPAGVDDSAYEWSSARQRRFDEEYVDRVTPESVRYRAPTKPQPPVSQEKWDKYRHIFGYGDVPSDFGR